MARRRSDISGALPDPAIAGLSLADVRARRDARETMLEMVRELARQTAIAHHEAAMRDLT